MTPFRSLDTSLYADVVDTMRVAYVIVLADRAAALALALGLGLATDSGVRGESASPA